MPAHDPSYKLLFSHRELVADLLRGFVREDWVGALDLNTLERPRESGISPDLRERERAAAGARARRRAAPHQ